MADLMRYFKRVCHASVLPPTPHTKSRGPWSVKREQRPSMGGQLPRWAKWNWWAATHCAGHTHTHTLYTQACERANTHTHTHLEHFLIQIPQKLMWSAPTTTEVGFVLWGRFYLSSHAQHVHVRPFFSCSNILSTNHNVNCTQNRIRINLWVVQLGSDYAVPAGTGPAILQNFCDLQHKERVSARAVLQQEESLFSPGSLSLANSGTDKCRNFMLHRKKNGHRKRRQPGPEKMG